MTVEGEEHTIEGHILQLAEDIERQSADFVWIELVASEPVAALVAMDSKLGSILRKARNDLPRAGFDWIEPSHAFRSAVALTRSELARASGREERRQVVRSFLNDADPPFLRQLGQA